MLAWQPVGRLGTFPLRRPPIGRASPFPGIVKCSQYQVGIKTPMDFCLEGWASMGAGGARSVSFLQLPHSPTSPPGLALLSQWLRFPRVLCLPLQKATS